MKTYKLPKTWIETAQVKIKNVSLKAILKFYLDFVKLVMYRTENEYGYVEIHSSILRKKNRRCQEILSNLEEAGLIKINHHYSNSDKDFTKSYMILDTDAFTQNLPINNVKELMKDAEDAVYRASVNCVKKINVNWDKYEVIKNELNQSSIYECMNYNQLVDIHNGNIKWSIGENVDRLFTPITNLKREFRECLTLDGEPMVEIDIVNCIPQMLGIFIKHYNQFIPLYEDYLTDNFDINQYNDTEQFENDVLNGIVYEKLAERTGLTRKEVKLAVMWLLFAKNSNPQENCDIRNAVKRAFRSLYPSAWQLICDLKKKEFAVQSKNSSYHVNFSRLLFKFETYFMFCVFGESLILNDITFTTIHDAFFIKQSDEVKVRSIMANAIKNAHNIEVKF